MPVLLVRDVRLLNTSLLVVWEILPLTHMFALPVLFPQDVLLSAVMVRVPIVKVAWQGMLYLGIGVPQLLLPVSRKLQ